MRGLHPLRRAALLTPISSRIGPMRGRLSRLPAVFSAFRLTVPTSGCWPIAVPQARSTALGISSGAASDAVPSQRQRLFPADCLGSSGLRPSQPHFPHQRPSSVLPLANPPTVQPLPSSSAPHSTTPSPLMSTLIALPNFSPISQLIRSALGTPHQLPSLPSIPSSAVNHSFT